MLIKPGLFWIKTIHRKFIVDKHDKYPEISNERLIILLCVNLKGKLNI